MQKLFICLFVVVSLLVAPLACASEWNCGEQSNCQINEHVAQKSKTEKQNKNKMMKSEQHCCCLHFSAIPLLNAVDPSMVYDRMFFILTQDAVTSVVVGLPLKPPSIA